MESGSNSILRIPGVADAGRSGSLGPLVATLSNSIISGDLFSVWSISLREADEDIVSKAEVEVVATVDGIDSVEEAPSLRPCF